MTFGNDCIFCVKIHEFFSMPLLQHAGLCHQGLEDVLNCYMKSGQTTTNRQLEIIIKMLNTPGRQAIDN